MCHGEICSAFTGRKFMTVGGREDEEHEGEDDSVAPKMTMNMKTIY